MVTTPKLLLADDSVTIRKVVELTFVDEGIEVFAVGDGDAAMQKFVEVQPDIVLVDVEMPGPSGYQICEMIKQDEATQHIPVLLLVGSFEPFDQGEAERVGADGFLTKPFHSIRELVARVSELLGNGDESTVEERLAADPETDDIEQLYSNSFTDTMPIQEYDTEEDLFREAGMDAEAIDPAGIVEASPENHEDPFGDAGLDDEMIEAVHPDGTPVENVDAHFVSAVDEPEPEAAQVKDFDWSPAAKVVDEPVPEPVEEAVSTGFEPQFAFADAETIEGTYESPSQEFSVARAHTETIAEPSEELIALIAKRVIEKLSDRVIREIAQEAVPQIAEKLIREALAEENKA